MYTTSFELFRYVLVANLHTSKLVIVPSQWKEAYGRVAKEAILLNIPVIVSDIGGLKEAVDYDKSKLVKNYKSIEEWIKKIQKLLLIGEKPPHN